MFNEDIVDRCDACKEPFKPNQARAEVALTAADELKGEFVGDILLVHADTCFDPTTMEVA